MSSNAPTPTRKAKRRGIPLQSGKIAGAGLGARFSCLPALLRVQRGLPSLPALHDIRDAAVLDSDAYRRNGGGHFARWQSAIADWHRHLYLTTHALREVAPDEVLLLSDTAEALPVAAPIVLQPGVWPPGIPAMPPSSRVTTCITGSPLPRSLSISPLPPLRHPAEQA